MGTEAFFIVAVGILVVTAIFDLVVGVSNDAVNFLNSSLGSRVAPRHVIMIIASFGIIAGVTFSGGMMEVARKGIFHPQFFTMPQLLYIFLAVMLTDVLLLDLYNTLGLPTSTTVSIVFELLGAAVAISLVILLGKGQDLSALASYINTSKAMMIIMGILLSVIVAFAFGAIAQFVSRLIFTFNYEKTLKRYGSLWGGMGLALIVFFILIKGAKGASFISAETYSAIKANAGYILLSVFAVSAVLLQGLITFFHFNILKLVVLVGTFAIAMAFAANDLVNFIGVPLAGYHAFKAAVASGDLLNTTMGALAKKVPLETHLLLAAGGIMVATLWLSRKARTVSDTEIGLGDQSEGVETFDSIALSRSIVRTGDNFAKAVKGVLPSAFRAFVMRRIDPDQFTPVDAEGQQSFDLVRASVNLMVASAVISWATSMKLPLSTTYVTFMVAMGTSFSDRAWGRETAVYRVTGVLTVIGGWFLTAFIAFTVAFCFANLIFFTDGIAVVFLVAFAGLVIYKSHRAHGERSREKERDKVFNLNTVESADQAKAITFEQMAYLLREIRESLDTSLEALFNEDVDVLAEERKKPKTVQKWANIIIANIFKVLRFQQQEDMPTSFKYAQTIRRVQKLADGQREIVMRSWVHLSNNHKGLLPEQIHELRKIKDCILRILSEVEATFEKRESFAPDIIIRDIQEMRDLADKYHARQVERIQDVTSKTRLTILFYALIGNCIMLGKQNLKLLEIFRESFPK
jgi:phosphate/sulfate permease